MNVYNNEDDEIRTIDNLIAGVRMHLKEYIGIYTTILYIPNIEEVKQEKIKELEELFKSKGMDFNDSVLSYAIKSFLSVVCSSGQNLLGSVNQNFEKLEDISKSKGNIPNYSYAQLATSGRNAIKDYNKICDYCCDYNIENNIKDTIEFYLFFRRKTIQQNNLDINDEAIITLFNDELKKLGSAIQITNDSIPDQDSFETDLSKEGFVKKYINN